jgi:hypothetical protein
VERGSSIDGSLTSTGFVAKVFSRYTSNIVTMSVSEVSEIIGMWGGWRRPRFTRLAGVSGVSALGQPV